MASASSSLSKGIRVTTGPKISSWLVAESDAGTLDDGGFDEPAVGATTVDGDAAAAREYRAAFAAGALDAAADLVECAGNEAPSWLPSSWGSPTRNAHTLQVAVAEAFVDGPL